MKLAELVAPLEVLEVRGGGERAARAEISGLAYHSEKVAPGNLFICITGYKTDGHLYLPRAVEKGAAAAVVEKFSAAAGAAGIPQFRVPNSRRAMAAMADLFYGHPSRAMKVIGITATNGKTTTTFMTNAILEEHGRKTGLIGTVIVKVGGIIRPAELTTPESLDLHALFRQMVEHGISHITMEVSSSGLDLYRVGNVDFDIVAMNNISREHIDLHGSFEAYLQVKSGLVRHARPEQWAIFNLDCPYTAALTGQTRARVLTYGLKSDAGDLRVRDLDLTTGRARFTVELRRTLDTDGGSLRPVSFPVELSVLGLHSVYNAMAAVSAGLLCGVPVPAIQRALHKFRGVERRFELIFNEGFKVIDDHFANSGNIDVTLETLKYMEYSKLCIVYAIRGNRGVTVNRENAEALARWVPQLGVDEVIATCSVSHTTDKDTVSEEEIAVFREVLDAAGIKYVIVDELPEAIALGLARMEPGAVLLLAGCQGMDHGARLALEQIHRAYPHLSRDRVFRPLENRVAGM